MCAKYLISQLRRAKWELEVARQAVLDQEMEVARLEKELERLDRDLLKG